MTEKKSFLDTMAEIDRPESFAEEKFVRVKDGKKRGGIIAGIIAAAIVIGGIGAFSYISNRVEMPALVGKTLVEATDWATKNKVTLYAKNVYNFEKDADTVLSQETQSGDYVKKNTTVAIEVSLGANPEEVIVFPDIKSMTTSEVDTWIGDKKLTGIRVTTAYSDVIQKDKVISYTFTDGSEDNFKRKNRVIIVVSLGSETLSETVIVTDFSAMKAGAVLQWGADNGIKITIEEAFDNYILSGSVVSQSVKTSTEILRTVGIKVVISKGKPVTVADLSTMTKDEANTWAKLNNVTLSLTEKYSDTKEKGKIYGQSISTNKSIEEGDTIKVNVSLGKIEIMNYVGKTKIDVLNWQTDANSKFANVKLIFTEGYGDKGSADKILSQSIKNDYISVGTTINVVISKGMKVVVPDFSGKTIAECNAMANNAGLNILYDYKNTTTIAKGLVISQSSPKDTVITDAEPIYIVISL